MTADAIALGGLVNHAEFLQFVFHHNVALKAKLARRGHQQVLVVGAMSFVAGRALPYGHRAVYELKAVGDAVTLGTQQRYSFFRNQEFVVAAVRIVALNTVAALDGLMYDLLGCLLQVAILAEVLAFSDELPGVLLDLQGLVARVAFAETDRSMHVGLLGVFGMAFRRNTSLLRSGRFFHRRYDGTGETYEHGY